MSTELLIVLITMLSVGGALAGLVLVGQRGLREEIRDVRGEVHHLRTDFNDLRTEVSDLSVRTARVEGLLDALRDVLVGGNTARPAAAVAEDQGKYKQD